MKHFSLSFLGIEQTFKNVIFISRRSNRYPVLTTHYSAIVRVIPSFALCIHFFYFIDPYVLKERRPSMSLIMNEQLKTQEKETSLTDMLDLVQSHSAAQTLDDANIAADDLLNNFTENDLEDQEEIDA